MLSLKAEFRKIERKGVVSIEDFIKNIIEDIFVTDIPKDSQGIPEAIYTGESYTDKPDTEWTKEVRHLREYMKDLVTGYLDTWGDSEDMRLLIVIFANDLEFMNIDDFEKCVAVLGEILRTGLPPASLVAAERIARSLIWEKEEALSTVFGGPRGVPIFDLWHRGLTKVQEELDLDGIENSPREVFFEFFRPHITELFDAHIADVYEQDRLDTEGIYGYRGYRLRSEARLKGLCFLQ